MKDPKFGSNRLQSFIDFFLGGRIRRFGIEDDSFFSEADGTKTNLFNKIGQFHVPVQQVTPLITTTVSTVSVAEYGDGRNFTTVLTLTDFIAGHIPAAAANLVIGAVVAAFPAGAHIEDSYYQNLSLKLPGAVVNADVGLGSVVGEGVHAALSDADSGAEDRLTGQTISTAPTGGAATAALVKSVLTGISVNVAASVKNIFLNIAGTWNVNNHSDLTVTGTIVIKWTKMSA